MARPKLNENEKKEKKLTVRYRSHEVQELQQQADLAGLSISELVRRRSLGRRVAPKADLKVIAELRRFGGLLKLIHNETGGLWNAKTGPLLDDARAAIIRIGRDEGAK